MKRLFFYTVVVLVLAIPLSFQRAFCECLQEHQVILMYQPWQADTERSELFWMKKMEEIKTAGFTTILLQWSAYGDVNYLQVPSFLSRLLTLAQQQNIKIIVGLWSDPEWFVRVKEDELALDFALRRIRGKHLLQARTILQEFENNPAIIGWYLPEEIDDKEWRSKGKQDLLKNHLQKIARQLGDLEPALPLMVSSFFAGFMTPDNYSSMLARLQKESEVLWLIQDGLGTGRLSSMETGRYMKALAEKKNKKRLQYMGIVELFTQTAKTSEIVPASVAEIRKRELLWCEEARVFPDIAFSLRYRFAFEK